MPIRRTLASKRIPIGYRIFVLPIGLALVFWAARGAAETLTEADVVRLSTERLPAIRLAQTYAALAEAQQTSARLYPNPTLGWNRRAIGGPDPETEDNVTLSVPLDFSGRRKGRAALGRSQGESQRAAAASTQSESVREALLTYYDAVAAERRAAVARQIVSALDEAARVVARRREEGTASGYDVARLAVERELATSELRAAASRAAAARAGLAALLSLDQDTLKLRARLAPEPSPTPARTATERESIQRARGSVTEAERARDRAASAWVPALSAAGGLAVRTTNATDYGYVAGLSFAVPLGSRGQGLQALASAQADLARADVRTRVTATRSELARATALLDGTLDELRRFTTATAGRVDRLTRAADTGYREGHRTVVEWVDAQRSRARVELRKIELALAARQAQLAVRAAQGEFE